ncbi:PKD domain-containing protein, partial [Vicingaceae bacterium]|nr:PKD domain-containing protein [Vicingaceae bacterium]
MRKYKLHIIKTLLLLAILLSVRQEFFASHLVGGTMSYECLGGDNYKITLTLYRDCNGSGAQFDNNASIGVFNNGSLISNELSPFTYKTPVPVIINNPCLIAPPNVCVEKTQYTQIINLPPITGGYDIVYQRCCRNASAMNIVSPSTMGSSYMVHIPEQNQAICNSSPTFNNPAPTTMCAGFEFTYDLSATDLDGDSLYYTFKDASTGGTPGAPAPNPPSPPPFAQIPWEAGYSTNYQIDANPFFTLDPSTGDLIGTPTIFGVYTFNVAVKEYRNGVYLGEIYRDLLLYVNNCQTNTVADFSDNPSLIGQTIFCSGTTVNITNNSLNSELFFWDFGDLTTNNDTSILETPTYTYADTGVYDITLVANPGYFCADTVIHQFTIHPALNPSFNAQTAQCIQGNLFNFNAIGNNHPDDTISWNFGSFGTPQTGNGANIQNSFTSTGTFPVEITMNNFGCSESYLDSVTVIQNPTASFSSQSIFCDGLTVSFDNNSTNSSSSYWEFGDLNNSTILEPNHNFPDSGSYQIMLVANQQDACFDTTYQIYDVYPALNVVFPVQANQCFLNNSFALNAVGNFNNSAVFNWDFNGQGNATNNNTSQTIINYDAPGIYAIDLNVQNYGCTSTFSGLVKIFLEPTANFSVPDIGCQPFKTTFINESTSSTPLSFYWDFGNGTTSTLENPTVTYYETGIFDVSLTVSSSSGCIGSDTLLMPHIITVNPTPIIDYIVNPLETYFINHQITATDWSKESFHQFDFGDG